MASPNLSSAGSASATASGSVGSGSRETTDIKAPLWDHVILSVIDLKCLYVELEHLFCNLICIVIYLLIK